MLATDVRIFILRALAAARGEPVPDDTLRQAIRTQFRHIAFTDAEISARIRDAQSASLITSATDDIFGRLWALTPKGALAAAQL